MSNISLPIPFTAYTGKEPYIFVSYAHVDGERVYPEIKVLYERGYRIWYDEGIDPGSKWPDVIAQAIADCAIFIVFISRGAIQSSNVIDEINFARNKNKPFLAIHQEDIPLPDGLELRISRFQAIIKWKLSKDEYLTKMLRALPDECLEKGEQAATQDVFIRNSHKEKPVTGQSNLPINKSAPVDNKPNQKIHIPDGFVFIKGGTYLMGSPENEPGSKDETQHPVMVGNLCMAKYPVTIAQFETFIRETDFRTEADTGNGSFIWNGSHSSKKSGINWRYDTRGDLQHDKQHPVIHVSWNDASAYCEWLSKKTGQAFRLPTEAEWEYACRAGTTTPFYTGANLAIDQANYNGFDIYQNHPKSRYIGDTTPVGQYPPNGWELYDMHGNVREWCRDRYGYTYYEECKRQGITDNPHGPKRGSCRVMRGGCCSSDALGCRSADRDSDYPFSRNCRIGFRLVFLP